MMNRVNPVYLIVLGVTIAGVFLFNVHIKKNILNDNNNEVMAFQKQVNKFVYLNSLTLDKNSSIEQVRNIVENELPKNILVNIKTLRNSIDIKLDNVEKTFRIDLLNLFMQSNLLIENFILDGKSINIKVKIK